MTNIEVGARLKAITSLVTMSTVIDVGADHGKAAAELLVSNVANKAYFTDISSKSLEKSQKLVNELGLNDRAEFVVCDGLKKFDNVEPCDVIIAGMGGEEIIKILSESKINDKVNAFILQPQKNVQKVRTYLVNSGYKIVKDFVVKDDKQFYFVIKAVRGEDKLTELELYFGRTNIEERPKDFLEYLDMQRKLFDDVVKNAKSVSSEKMRYYELLQKI